jgi:mono/diheme cytochrome c family protein
MRKPVVIGWRWKAFLSVLLVAFVFFTVQTLQPMLDEGGVARTKTAWIGATPAHAAPPDGEAIYMARCAACHMPNGEGNSLFPPLAESEYVYEDSGRLIRIILHGLKGEIKVHDKVYNGEMPPWGSLLSDEEVAAVASFVRASWGNFASEVTSEQVTRVRQATADRTAPWTVGDFEDKANRGIPGETEAGR